MKLVFYHESERIFKDEVGNLYTSGNFTPEVWDRYLSVCDHLTVIMTDSGKVLSEEEAKKTKQQIDTDKITVVLLPDRYASFKKYFSIKRKQESNRIQKEAFNACDYAIIRSANSPAIAMFRKTGKPYAIEVVGCLWDSFWNHSLRGKLMALYEFLISKYNVKKADYVLYVTNKFLQRRYPTRGKTVNCSNVSLSGFDDKVLEARLEKIKNHNGKIILGTAAALDVRYKGQQYVIKALGRLKKHGITNFQYDLVGRGDQAYLRRVAEKHGVTEQINFIGQIPHDGVLEWLKGIDLYIQPSLQEGLPRSVIEAMSMGLPCAGSSVAGIPELLNDSMLFKGKDFKAIAHILGSLNKENMLSLAKENYEEAKQYDVEILSKRRTEFYNDFRKFAENKKDATK